MPHCCAEKPLTGHPAGHRAHRRTLWLVLIAGLIVSLMPGACAARARSETSARQLSVEIKSDRLTLAVTGVPQVYLSGVIDASALQRIRSLVEQGRIPAGSDVYLNASGGDPQAGMSLGRLFRSKSMATHLGTRRKGGPRAAPAICTDACAYAFLGGLYRWPATGGDRFGLPNLASDTAHAGDSAVTAARSYLSAMGLELTAMKPLWQASGNPVMWLNADQMRVYGLTNNGALAPTASYSLAGPAPFLELKQTDRSGEHRLTFTCQPGRIVMTAFNQVGTDRARQIVARGTRSYFALNRRETLSQPHGATVAGGAVAITRDYPPDQLVYLLSSHTVGAWVTGNKQAFRDGFALPLYPVREAITRYYQACRRAAPWNYAPQRNDL